MIIERRKITRVIKNDGMDWASEFNFDESVLSWEDEQDLQFVTTPWPLVMAFAMLTGLSAFAVGSYFLLDT